MNLDKWTKRLQTRALANDGQLAYLKSQKRERQNYLKSTTFGPSPDICGPQADDLHSACDSQSLRRKVLVSFHRRPAFLEGMTHVLLKKQRKSSSCHRTIGYVQADSCAIADKQDKLMQIKQTRLTTCILSSISVANLSNLETREDIDLDVFVHINAFEGKKPNDFPGLPGLLGTSVMPLWTWQCKMCGGCKMQKLQTLKNLDFV